MNDSIMEIMDSIEYGFPDKDGNNIINNIQYYDEYFNEFYYLQSPEELLNSKIGVCWCQVELERKLFKDKLGIDITSYWICTYDNDNLPSHTFAVYTLNNRFYWFEHSWNKYKGIHIYDSLNELLNDIKIKHLNDHPEVSKNALTLIYKYDKPKYHISCDDFYKYIDTQELIELEKNYFYHLVNKDADLSKGLLSLQYMYDNNMDDMFFKYVEKYKDRITNYWNIEEYKDKENLTKEDYINALNIFRGPYGSKYIYFFKYPPYKELGPNMENILKYKDIYRIDLNNKDVLSKIEDIFYGYDLSNSDNKLLDKEYYDNVGIEEYFSKYDDNSKMNFASLNHIAISFKDGYIPIELLERVEENE